MLQRIIQQLIDEDQQEEDVTLLLRAAVLLADHPDYARDTGRGCLLRRTRLGLIAMLGRVEGSRSEEEQG